MLTIFFSFFSYIYLLYIYTYLIVYWFLFFLHPLYVHYYPAKTRYLTQPCYYTYDNQLISSPLVFFIFYFEHIYIYHLLYYLFLLVMVYRAFLLCHCVVVFNYDRECVLFFFSLLYNFYKPFVHLLSLSLSFFTRFLSSTHCLISLSFSLILCILCFIPFFSSRLSLVLSLRIYFLHI